jgi:FkbM family methyltransferase
LKRVLDRFDFLICAAGDASGHAVLRVPTLRGVPLSGASSLVRGAWGDRHWLQTHPGSDAADLEMVEQTVETRRLDDHALEPSFVKVDVEGFELPVLRGLAETIERHRPILLVENSGHAADDVRRFLETFAYQAFVYRAERDVLEPHAGEPTQNLFYLPADVPAG